MKKTLEKAAKAGRYGDNRLLHVSDTELEGLASLHPKGKLPTNPETGLPEAFFFLPFLAGLGSIGAGAATAAAALPAAATAATTAASAIPAAATIGGALGTAALPAAQAATLGATTAASALPAATAAIPAAATSALPAATAALPSATSTLSAATPTLLGSGGLDTLAATTPSMLANPAATTATSLPSVAANPASAPLFKPAMDAALTNAVTPSTLASPSSVVSSAPASITPAVTPPSTIPGINATTPGATLLGPAPASTTSGIFSGSNMSTMMQGLAPLAAMMGGSDMPEMEEQEAPKLKKTTYHRGKVSFKGSGGDGEHDYFPDDKYKGSKATKRKFAMGGLVKGYAEGGLASLDNSSGEMSDKDLIQATKQALIEQSPDAQQLVAMFLSTFGHTALADLMSAIHQSGEGQPDPMGDGMSDSVPATVTGNDGSQGLASLSEGEFVIPADVVSGLGNGSTEAGARQLDGMMSKVRQHTSNGSKQPEAMNPSDVMPV